MAEKPAQEQEQKRAMDPAVLDDIIRRLVEFRNTRPGSGKQVHLSEGEIRQLCAVSKEIFLQQPNLLELEAPIKICGQIFALSAYKISDHPVWLIPVDLFTTTLLISKRENLCVPLGGSSTQKIDTFDLVSSIDSLEW